VDCPREPTQFIIPATSIRLENGQSHAKETATLKANSSAEVIVFTGSLSVPRQDAADLAAEAGCRVEDGVTKHTTMLVVGDQDLRILADHEKSTKHIKAERLIEKGQSIRILRESDFMRMSLLPIRIVKLLAAEAILPHDPARLRAVNIRPPIHGAQLPFPLPLPGLCPPVRE